LELIVKLKDLKIYSLGGVLWFSAVHGGLCLKIYPWRKPL